MANEEADQPGKQPLSPAKRRRLQQCFEQGSKVAAAGQFDYATDMYTMCVLGDPANPIYVKSFLGNLQKKYNNNKKGSKLAGMKGMGAKAAIKKAGMQKDWNALITSGLEMLKLNPWDTSTLIEIARACEALEFDECQIEYLRMAMEADPADGEVNRVCARALGRQGQFDEAIACWNRVLKSKGGNDEEAQREMGNLSVERTIHKGGYETAESTKQVRADKIVSSQNEDKRLTPQQQLERAIVKDPTDIDKYIELAELHLRDDKFEPAEEVLARGVAASGNAIPMQERLEDLQLRRGRHNLALAERKARDERTEAAIELYNKLKTELNSKEIEVYRGRCDRHPANLGYKCELAIRMERAKKFNEAITLYQQARTDQKRRGQVLMGLGRCFTQIKQYKMALGNFAEAVEAIPEKEVDQRKEALYLAGKVAVHIKDLDTAEKNLQALASLDFGYKDVADWLDKLAKLREDGDHTVDE
jgi:tetratricopeptide (TPR) repeat protein